MDSNYTAKLVYSGEEAAVSFDHSVSYIDFANSVRDRFPVLGRSIVNLRYTVYPDVISYRLENEDDMKMMFRVLARYSSDFVDVDVCSFDVSASGSESVLSNNVSEYSSVSFDENDYLRCYKPEEAKRYCSKGWENYIKSKDQKFQGGVKEFRLKLRMYAIEMRFEYKYVRNTKKRVVAYCSKRESEHCGWCVKASLLEYNRFFVITDLVNEHSCHSVVRLQTNKMMGFKIIKSIMLDKVRENPNKKAIDIYHEIKLDYGMEVSYRTAWYGKERARESVLGGDADFYAQLVWFGQKAVESNPGSTIKIEYEPETRRFERMFVCYDAWMKGFQFCRLIMFIDATFISNKYRGQLIGASAKNANQGLYPVAYAIVDSETESNWRFFLQCVSEVLSRHPMRQVTFIFDRNPGLLSAYLHVFPNNPHDFCLRHLVDNLSKKYPSQSPLHKSVPYLFMCCAYSCTPDSYETNLAKLKEEGGSIVEDFLKDLPKESWCSAFFNGERFGEMTNNLAETFNNWVGDLKSLPIYDLNEGIRTKSMERIAERKEGSKEWVTVLCPNMEKKLINNLAVGRHWRVMRSDTYVYEVQCQKYRVMVNLGEDFVCSCGEWKCHGFPCSHALVAIQQHGVSPYLYVSPYYKVDKFRETYSHTINPIPSISMHVDLARSSFPLQPPLTKRPAGRPKIRRYRSRSEVKRQIKCSRCGKYNGHNRTSCKAPM